VIARASRPFRWFYSIPNAGIPAAFSPRESGEGIHVKSSKVKMGPRLRRDDDIHVIPAEAGIQVANWAPACAGATANFVIPAAFSPCKNGVTAARAAATARQ
jgi:hypothetical protein